MLLPCKHTLKKIYSSLGFSFFGLLIMQIHTQSSLDAFYSSSFAFNACIQLCADVVMVNETGLVRMWKSLVLGWNIEVQLKSTMWSYYWFKVDMARGYTERDVYFICLISIWEAFQVLRLLSIVSSCVEISTLGHLHRFF